jgi:outer membrane protein assembly factor BamE (lipoprotein component of BamABCDE complex)
MNNILLKVFLFLLVVLLSNCSVPMEKVNKSMEQDQKNQLTLGKIQQTLKKGIAQDQIVVAMGSPNLVTVDSEGLETWIYDKISTEITSANASNSATILGGGLGSKIGAGGILGSSGSAAKQITSQKTLTVVLKFKDKKLESYTYNASKF